MTDRGTYDPEKKRWICNECGTVCLNEQGLDLHWYYKHGAGSKAAGKDRPSRPAGASRPAVARQTVKPDEDACRKCGGPLRLLSSKVAAERRAIAAGASVVCVKCDTLYKTL